MLRIFFSHNKPFFEFVSGMSDFRVQSAAGDSLYFPNNEKRAHKLTNVSKDEPLVYADFDIRYDPEVAFYPDSGKVGIFGKKNRLIFPVSKQTDYYEGE